jgi:uncharacterized protein
LIQLERSGYIKKVDVPGRNHYYEIDERFFNIWLLMSEAAPYDTRRVIWLTKWLDAFYSNDELRDFAGFCQSKLRNIKPANRLLIAQALSESRKLEYRYKKKLIDEIAEDLKDMSEAKILAEGFNQKWFENNAAAVREAVALTERSDYAGALDKLNAIENIDDHMALFKGVIYHALGNKENAEKYLLVAADKGEATARVILAAINGTIIGLEEAIETAVQAAGDGNTDALFLLGEFYRAEKSDMVKAEEFYSLAADKGNDKASFNLGYLYEHVKGDLPGAKRHYDIAAERGNDKAMYSLGLIYEKENNMSKAIEHYLRAAELGNTDAMNDLAVIYEYDLKDIGKAEEYYLMAAKKDNADAMYGLGYLYLHVKKDVDRAEHYYLMAAEKGDVEAMLELSNLYWEERKDLDGAEKYLHMALDKGDTRSMFNLGILYENERNDIINAEKYYLMGAEHGDVDSIVNLGHLYWDKKNDLDQAERYFQLAAEKGDIEALVDIGSLYALGRKDLTQAEKYFRFASEKGSIDGKASLASLYFESNNVNRKVESCELAREAFRLVKEAPDKEESVQIAIAVNYIAALLWNEKINDATILMEDILSRTLHTDSNLVPISQGFKDFLIFKQRQFLYKLFSANPEWIDRYKPIYYVLMHEMQEEYPKEFLKMSPELEEPVQAIIDFIRKERERLKV